MRDVFLGVVIGLAGVASYWVVLMLMVAREGVGPGDSLSSVGYVIPTLVGGLVIAAGVRRSTARLLGSGSFWILMLAISAVMQLLVGTESGDGLLDLAVVAACVHLPAGVITLLSRAGPSRKPG